MGLFFFFFYCSESCRYDQILLAHPIYLKDVIRPLTKSFYATDIWFVPGSEKSPLLIADIDICEKAKLAKFKGIKFATIEQ